MIGMLHAPFSPSASGKWLIPFQLGAVEKSGVHTTSPVAAAAQQVPSLGSAGRPSMASR
jgi:hypothetical protein